MDYGASGELQIHSAGFGSIEELLVASVEQCVELLIAELTILTKSRSGRRRVVVSRPKITEI
ncbi:hypothetical protein T265_12197 [Opisthorchis viverrini]|uniref:Uncharacterized protein n=1 Tax=Opisthorchis viverrini TaxID=6198 RepID=A0A074YVA7_OPIVI|nr:hypothetical protein T265_12197 [Opisthorchis viverrini]KER18666.1 hypothetical protein T265_12197 [Opisthorchis viverrini]